MRKEQIAAVLWTLGLAIPFAALALFGAAYLTDHLVQIVNGLASIEWRSLSLENSARSPELAGMVLGQALLLVLLFMVRSRPADRTA